MFFKLKKNIHFKKEEQETTAYFSKQSSLYSNYKSYSNSNNNNTTTNTNINNTKVTKIVEEDEMNLILQQINLK